MWPSSLRFIALATLALVSGCAAASRTSVPDIGRHPMAGDRGAHAEAADRAGGLRVMTLNLAHGRRDGLHQLFESRADILENLEAVATVIRREAPHALALQEVDRSAFWTGGVDQLNFVSELTNLAVSVGGAHVEMPGLEYGTALLARAALVDPLTHTFAHAGVTPRKGFVVAALPWPGTPGVLVDLVSVHLDFASADRRRAQARELVEVLRGRERPLVLMGDLNAGWENGRGLVRYLCDALRLQAVRPDDRGLATFGPRRLDWILASHALRITAQRVLPDVLSDHRAVVADLALDVDRVPRRPSEDAEHRPTDVHH
jgi:endonuclease/exonuclease/phosphatase family metal-dependent hydrolase